MNILKLLFGIKEKPPATETKAPQEMHWLDKLGIMLDEQMKELQEQNRIEAINLDLKASGKRLFRAGKSTLKRKIWRL